MDTRLPQGGVFLFSSGRATMPTMLEFPDIAIQTVAWSKVLLAAGGAAIAYILLRRPKPWLFATLLSVLAVTFYLLLVWPLQRMWWGNNGDEMFILAYLSQVLKGNPWNDFYYHGLPQFYPPLYFWVTGLVSRLFAQNAITATKFGVAATFGLWFLGTYGVMRIFDRHVATDTKDKNRSWWWVLIPLVFLFLLDFSDVFLKPYKTLPGLGVVLWIGLFAREIAAKRWGPRMYAFFGISGGLLFLTYYFWWFMAIPAMLVLAFGTANRRAALARFCGIGAIMLLFSLPYIVPLLLSYQGGMENWQAFYFHLDDFRTWIPFGDWGWRMPLALLGFSGLILLRRDPFVRGNLYLLGFAYLYQGASVLLYLVGQHPLQAANPFKFLANAALAVGAVAAGQWLWDKHVAPRGETFRRGTVAVLLITSLPLWPMTLFLDGEVTHLRLVESLPPSQMAALAPKLAAAVPDWERRTWLTSGTPDLNAYLPIHYFVAHNPHFSHHAARYGERFEAIERLAAAGTAAQFADVLSETPIDALLFWRNDAPDHYPFFFWDDNYPNAAKEGKRIFFRTAVDGLGWTKAYEDGSWIIYLKP